MAFLVHPRPLHYHQGSGQALHPQPSRSHHVTAFAAAHSSSSIPRRRDLNLKPPRCQPLRARVLVDETGDEAGKCRPSTSSAKDETQATTPPLKATSRSRTRQAQSDQTRRAFVLSAGILATLALTQGSRPAEAVKFMRKDEEVWAPLEDYMQVNERAAQTTYSPKFTAYLSRLLINYDYASMNWWERKTMAIIPASGQRIGKLLASKGFDGTFSALDSDGDSFLSKDEFLLALNDPDVIFKREQELLSQFQASVNFGLVRYQGTEGARRLLNLLKSEFGLDRAGKRQIALLFSLMDKSQPVEDIKQLIAEAENSRIAGFNVTYAGFGYNAQEPPKISISASPGTNKTATAEVILEPTGRLLKVVMEGPFSGFSSPPSVVISPPANGTRATAIAKMNGDRVERIVLSNPGSGYTLEDKVSITFDVEGQPLLWFMPSAKPVMEMKVAGAKVKDPGYGYAHDLPITITVDPPPFPVGPVATAKLAPILTEPTETIIRSWLPSASVSQSQRALLPNNLVPKYDPCLERFFVSPVEELDPNYCIYFEDEFKVVPSQKFNKYFSFLDGPKARSPVEKERELDPSVFWRFALSGAICCGTAHAVLITLDVVKTKMQADPQRYPSPVEATEKILKEGGPRALLVGAGATIVGYVVYGGVSFGLTEYFKRLFLILVGPEYATLYPFAVLLLASMSAAFFGAVAVTPFEALRIRSVTVEGFKDDLIESFKQVAKEQGVLQLFAGLAPTIIGEIPFMMTKFAVFDAVSKALYSLFPLAEETVGFSLVISLLSGMTAGVAAAVVSHPFDTLTTRVAKYAQLQQGGGGVGVLGAVKEIYAQGGLEGFFKGTLPRAVKSAANIALQFFLYDFLKRALHISTDDLKLFFDVMSGLEVTPGPPK